MNAEISLLKGQIEKERKLLNKTLKEKAKQIEEERTYSKMERDRLLQIETELNIKAIQVNESYEVWKFLHHIYHS